MGKSKFRINLNKKTIWQKISTTTFYSCPERIISEVGQLQLNGDTNASPKHHRSGWETAAPLPASPFGGGDMKPRCYT